MNRAAEAIVTEKDIVDFESDGVVCLRRVLDGDWVDRMQGAVDRITENPGPMRESYYPDKPGDFFSEKFMWTFDRDFRFYVFESPVAAAVGRLMRTRRLNFFYDHLLVKEPGTVSATEWHQDTNFWPFSGRQIASLWAPLDRVTRGERGARVRTRLPPLARPTHVPADHLRRSQRKAPRRDRQGGRAGGRRARGSRTSQTTGTNSTSCPGNSIPAMRWSLPG